MLKKVYVYTQICMTESLCRMPETNTLQINYISTKILKTSAMRRSGEIITVIPESRVGTAI